MLTRIKTMPPEIRLNIMMYMVNTLFTGDTITPPTKRSACLCFDMSPAKDHHTKLQQALVPRLSVSMANEFFDSLCREKAVHFTCTCDMLRALESNEYLFVHLRRLKIHWSGPNADKAFAKLAQCPKLEEMTIQLSSDTWKHLTPIVQHFRRIRTFRSAYDTKRFVDVVGCQELLAIRGMRKVETVMFSPHLPSAGRMIWQRADTNVDHLGKVCKAMMMLPRGVSRREKAPVASPAAADAREPPGADPELKQWLLDIRRLLVRILEFWN